MSNTPSQQWNVHCPHCGADFTETKDGLLAGHTRAMLQAAGSGRAAETMENFEIPCPKCKGLVGFEPLSRYRLRKHAALEKIIEDMTALEDAGREEKWVIDIFCPPACAISEMLVTGNPPLEVIREENAKIIATVEAAAAARGINLKTSEPVRMLREMASIAQADIGERNDLPDASRSSWERTRAALESIQQAKQAPAKTPAPAAKSKCFIATAACGTPDHPLVEILREFRDETLARHRAGRTMMRLYDFLSPPVADWIGARPFARDAVRVCVVRPAAFCAGVIRRGRNRP